MRQAHSLSLSRRHLLGAAGGLVGATGLGALGLRPLPARALTGSELKFVFVVNYGGWDPTRVFASEFANPFVDMERDAEERSIGDLVFVDHESRPQVRAFLERHASRTLFFNGVLVSSVAHENCLRISLTGSTAQDRSDWGAILAGNRAEGYALPQVVIGGPSFPGAFGAFVTRTGTNGQLQELLDGRFLDRSDIAVESPGWQAEDIMDRYLLRRSAAAAGGAEAGPDAGLHQAWDRSLQRAQYLKGLSSEVSWSGATSFGGQAALACDLLSRGVSRVATLSFSYYSWDTHTANDTYQSLNFERLFTELSDLLDLLSTRPGEAGRTLADETVLVVLSEMGRTPQLNTADGKDHWPYTSVMVTGPRIAGGRVIGGFDSSYYGRTIDPATGELAENATNLSSEVVGATLLAAADVDPEEFTPGVSPVLAALA